MKAIWKRWFNKDASANIDDNSKAELKNLDIPEHVAIIMDGNGRWAKSRMLPRAAGHSEGMKVIRRITKFANEVGVKALTLYAFSTENWKRPEKEVNYLMKLPVEFLDTFLPELIEENVRVNIMGEIDGLPNHTRAAVEKAMKDTAHNDGLLLNLAFNYGSRAEMLLGVKQLMEDVKKGKVATDDITEELFSSYLMTDGIRDPDLLIRTSGEIRLSNFMLWQLAYTEFWFTDVLWPDFTEKDFMEAIKVYQARSRRYGGL
ncbi:isoprenyl transferase [Bacillus massiliigorillae]|uniref:isoprenyl transferase n=1 Tax=Bacillus massiliigorillae TaxID=1243664 RepID=UPI0003A5AD38|nr:isoprenyl transferase [Bacillus massiliigorillae]